MLKIYHSQGARSLRVLWLCEEMGVPYETAEASFMKPSEEFKALNPLRTVPVMQDGDVTMIESVAMMIYIMAKHVWEKAEDIKTFPNFPPVSLGAYVFQESDPNGFWELWKRRDDWQKTTVGLVTGKAGPEYIMSIFYGDSAKKAIAVSRHNLDVLFDADIEAFQAIQGSTPTMRSWFADFPWAYPNELDYRFFGFNQAVPPYDNKDVRWALTLALDIVDACLAEEEREAREDRAGLR